MKRIRAYADMSRRKGRFGKFGPQKKRRNMAKIRCYGCNELGQYKKDCPKFKDKRKKEEAHSLEKWKNPIQRNLRKKK